MKFGYFCNTTNWNHKPYNQLLNETQEITTYCDENNWDSIWYTEHHFNHEGIESFSSQFSTRLSNLSSFQSEVPAGSTSV